jgi:hypothetical protein
VKPVTEIRDSTGWRGQVILPKRLLLLSSWIKTILFLAVGVGLFFVLDNVRCDTGLTLEHTRPIAQLATLLLGAVALWGVAEISKVAMYHDWQIAWRVSLRMVGWLGVAGSLGAIFALVFQSEPTDGPVIGGAVRSVESIIPLVIGIQAAFLLAPEDEPGIEVLLACPRPISWALLERFAVVFLSQTVIAVVGMAISAAISGEGDLLIMVARWLPSALFFSGVSVYTTLASRQPAFSVASVGILWLAFRFFGGALLPGQPTFWPLNVIQPFIWAIHPYLQPLDLTLADWWLNRALVAALGITFIMMTVSKLHDEEQVLLGGGKIKKKATEGT